MTNPFKRTDRKIFDIAIGDKLYEVWDRPDEAHPYGDSSETWWLLYDKEWVPYNDNFANRISWKVVINTSNYVKHKWEEVQLYKSGHVELSANNKLVYVFSWNDLDTAFAKAQSTIIELSSLPFNITETDKEIGRKIWFYKQPAILESFLPDQGCIYIRKDGPGGFDLVNPWYTEEDIELDEWNNSPTVKTDLLSTDIYWFRN